MNNFSIVKKLGLFTFKYARNIPKWRSYSYPLLSVMSSLSGGDSTTEQK
jgi:hypothetical protein